jgi:voltage-gated potassium channel
VKIPVASMLVERRRRRRLVQEERDPWRRFRGGLLVLATVLIVGTVGYTIIGIPPFDALYQTAITITTVGYGEIGPEAELDTAYRVFTLVLVLVGASSAIYTVSVLLETIVEGSLNDGWRRRRMDRLISTMDDHVIIAGWGRVGRSIAAYAARHDADVVAIDLDEQLRSSSTPIVIGDANDDDVLVAAGIERAAVLIAALSSDAENLSLTLTARSLNPGLFIVARTSSQRHERKFAQAGADRVVNPYEIGGSRMGAIALQPHVAEFLDEVLHDESHDVEIHEVVVQERSELDGVTIGSIAARVRSPLVVAVRSPGQRFVTNPDAERQVGAGDVLIVLGNSEALGPLRWAGESRPQETYRGRDLV